MVGSHFVASDHFRVAAAGRVDPSSRDLRVERFAPVDIADPDRVLAVVRDAPEGVVVNFAARTDVDGVERERPAGGARHGGAAWTVNTGAAEAMARGSQETGKYLVQISTDFVFDGTAGPYSEDSPVSPLSDQLNWYGWTKSEGERLVAQRSPNALILRIAFPYRTAFPHKVDFARWMLARYQEGKLPPLFSDQQITPTWVPDVTRALATLIPRRTSGILHVASPEVTSPFEFGRELLTRLNGTPPTVVAGSMTSGPATAGRAPRPLKGGLRSVRAPALGLSLTSWRQGIEYLARGTTGGL
jgi:dTDP-4-dehydrorhamnose reductase